MNLLKTSIQKVKSFWKKAVNTAKKIWPMAFAFWVMAFCIAQGLDIPATSAFDGTSIVTAEDVTGLNTEVSNGWMTLIATVLSLSTLLITMFFGNKIFAFLKRTLSGRT